MSRIQLRHLSVVGQGVLPASIEFSERVTLVLGPSDTGKSFIVGAIDFMLGAKALPDIPELGEYSTVLLGLSLGDRNLTLVRSTSGGRFSLYEGLLEESPVGVPEITLAAAHSAKSDDNVSSLLLDAITLNGREVQRNQVGATDSLSFRDVARLVIVDETKMQSPTPPALSGTHTTASKETSILRVLLEDDDDAGLLGGKTSERSRLAEKAKIEVYNRLLSEIEEEMKDIPAAPEARGQLERLMRSISETASSMSALRAERDAAAEQRAEAIEQLSAVSEERSEASELIARFNLLRRQYESDLDRLEMLSEAGSLLGFFTRGACVFCGADEEHQHFNQECDGDVTHFGESVGAESSRTRRLLEDLTSAIADLSRRHESLGSLRTELQQMIARVQQQIEAVESRMRPVADDLTEVMDARSRVEKCLGLHQRHDSLVAARAELLTDAARDTSKVSSKMQHSVLADFSREIVWCLEAWGVPDLSDVRYDRNEQDIFQGNQFRSAHGKGLRSVLHAAFTVGLAQFCLRRDLPHPGFVVLDSPIVTYRPPDYDGDEDEGEVPPDFAQAFYRDLDERFLGQAIVMENVEPAGPLSAEVARVAFSKRPTAGRYGYFPMRGAGVPD
jgi:hypothetical protein